MGSKGSNQTQTAQTQQYTPDPAIRAAGYQALGSATTASQAPFQMPQAPVAPFNPFQQQAFSQIQGMQGMSQPYFDQGQQYLQQSAQGPTADDINSFYNPMASNVTAQMQNIFGQQQSQATRSAVGAAGGVGADRIAVAQGNLANQQGLAAGQTYAGLYQQALQAAQQQKQMQAGAGYGIAQMGPAAQAAALQGTSALGGAGNQQQQQAQAQLNAPYQQQLAQIAYPFQTAQYLAGITGGLAPALGGTTAGQGTTTYPTPSPLSQILGAGTAGVGALGAAGAFGKGSNTPSTAGAGSTFTPDDGSGAIDVGGAPMNYFRRGGRMADGGDPDAGDPSDQPSPFPGVSIPKTHGMSPVPYIPLQSGSGQFHNNLNLSPPKQQQSSDSGLGDVAKIASTVLPFFLARGGSVSPYDMGQGFADGGADDFDIPYETAGSDSPGDLGGYATAQERDMGAHAKNQWMEDYQPPPPAPMQGVNRAIAAEVGNSPSPYQAPAPYAPPTGGDEAPGYGPAQTIAPNTPMPQARPQQAALTDEGAEMPDVYKGAYADLSSKYGPKAGAAMLGNLGVESPGLNPDESHDSGTGIGMAGWRNERKDALFAFAQNQGMNPSDRRTQLAFLDHEIQTNPKYQDMVKRMQAAPTAADAARIFRTEYERPAGTTQGNPLGMGRAAQLANNFQKGDFSGVGGDNGMGSFQATNTGNPYGGHNADMSMATEQMPRSQQPYPDATNRDWGQNATRSPWMALVKAGATMASATGPIGSVIGKGIAAGAGELESQRKELRSEEDINNKAGALYQQAKQHLNQYQRMTPYQQQSLARENYTPTYATTKQGHPIILDRKSGIMKDGITGNPVDPEEQLSVKGGAGGAGGVWKQKHDAWLVTHQGDEQGALDYAGGHKTMTEAEIQKSAITLAQRDAQHDSEAASDYRGYMDRTTKQYADAIRRNNAAGGPGPTPSRPAGVPPDAGYSPSQKTWVTRDGKKWNENGEPQ